MSYRIFNAARTTITRDVRRLDEKVADNLFETIVVLSKRANQISKEMKEELNGKLEEFSTSSDNLEEIFENREQIEISRHYEKLPKPTAISIQELLENRIYWRDPAKDQVEG